MMSRSLTLSVLALLLVAGTAFAQSIRYPDPPAIKSYKGIQGKITKYNHFNYLDIHDNESGKNRQSLGAYWEISFNYDSVFRQKRKFRDFVVKEIEAVNGTVYSEDTIQIHFGIPAEDGNIWGRAIFSNDKLYRLRLIREKPFQNRVHFDSSPLCRFDSYVDSIPLPPRINYFPKALITRAQYSKYDHQEFTWNVKDTLYKQKVMGVFWEIKLEVRNDGNSVDKFVSTVEILESYYRACLQAGGTVLKSRPRELVFTLPLKQATLWTRVSVSLDGVYFIKSVLQADQDKTPPVKLVSVPSAPADSLKTRDDL